VMKDVRGGMKGHDDEAVMQMISSAIGQVAGGLSRVSDELSTLAGIVESGFEEMKWALQQQTEVLLSIDQTLKSPSQTQAREWRVMAEQLRTRTCFDEAEEWFLKSLQLNPLDYRTYVGLALNYLRKNDFDKAEEVLIRSFPHAPKGTLGPGRRKKRLGGRKTEDMTDEELEAELDGLFDEGEEEHLSVIQFDYRSLSHRLVGRIYACRGDYQRASAELQSAIGLSPEYPEGNYDYALYSRL
jgi:tetratricopeptide (TPR) repeat protein